MTPRSRILRQLWPVVFGVLVVAALAPRVRVTPARATTPSSLVLEKPCPIASLAMEQARPRRVAIDRSTARDVPRVAIAIRPETPGASADGRYLYLIHEALLC